MEIKNWSLEYLQSVSVDNFSNVYFNHHNYINDIRYGLVLSENEFQDLHDIIVNWENYKQMKRIPIGKHIWLNNKHNFKQLYNSHTRKYFQFFFKSWEWYKNDVHYLIFHYLLKLKHGIHLQNRKPYADNISSQSYRSRDFALSSSSIKTSKRPSSYVSYTPDKWAKYTDISKWKNSSSGCNFQFRRTADEMRASIETKSNPGQEIIDESTSDKNSELDDIESCSID